VGRDADPYSPPKTSPRMVVNASTNQSTSRNRKGRLRSVAAVSFFVVDRNAAKAVPLLRGSRGRYGAPPPPAAVAGEGAGPPRCVDARARNENVRATIATIAIAAASHTMRF